MIDSVVCPLVEFGRSDNLFYFSPVGFSEDYERALSRLERLTYEEEVVLPAHFLLSPQRDFLIGELNKLPCRKRLLIGLAGEEREQVSEVRRLLVSGWGLDLIVEKAVDGEALRRLALYRDNDVRIIFLVNRRHHQMAMLESLPGDWRDRSSLLFLPPGERDDLFLTADEVFLFQDDLQKSRADLEIPVMVYRPLLTTIAWNAGSQFFAQPEIENYGPHFLRLKGWPRLRRWIVENASGGGAANWKSSKAARVSLLRIFIRVWVPVLFALVEPLRHLHFIYWPIKRAYWFVKFQITKRRVQTFR